MNTKTSLGRRRARRLGPAAGFAAAILALWLGAAPSASAVEMVPGAIAQSLRLAAQEGHRARASDALYFDVDRRAGNYLLAAAALDAIAQRPDLTVVIVAEAIRLAPGNRDALVAELTYAFPAFAAAIRQVAAGTIVAAAPAPAIVPVPDIAPAPAPAPSFEPGPVAEPVLAPAPAPPSVVEPAAIEGPSLAERPEGWPILPREGGADGYADDPLEGFNQVFFYVNGTLDFLIFEPLARVYGVLMPEFAKPRLRDAFKNLSLPIVLGNDLLQLQIEDAGETLARFVINSTVGIAGLFDVAAELGIRPHRRDFGQTLHAYGVGEGFYLVLPLFGPSNLRDAVGTGVDSLMDPKNYLIETLERLLLGVGEGIVLRESLIDPVEFLKANAADKYEAVRAWSWQQRRIELEAGCERRQVIACPGP